MITKHPLIQLTTCLLLISSMVAGWHVPTQAQLATQAMTLDPDDPIPFEPNTRVGTLPNGMKYYVRQNSKPENYAELRLALNAGSLLETPGQQGLAHFVEHMCFNGTADFPKMSIVNYLESIGTKFGAHLNAYTSFEETVYMLRVPTDDPERFTQGLNILENWAHKVSFEGEEIEKERGVVIEEWRSRLGASWRMNQVVYPKLFYDSRYAERFPIGKVPVLETFPHDTLVHYYQTWYRPDLMAIIAVGDFDVDEVEQMIQQKFGTIPSQANPVDRPDFEIPLHEETLIALAEDEEATNNTVRLVYKHQRQPVKTMGDYRRKVVDRLAATMLNQRLDELTQTEAPPITYASVFYFGFGRTLDAYSCLAIVPEGHYLKGIETLLVENERVVQHGFTVSELDRAKETILNGTEKSYDERDKTPSNQIIRRYVNHFLEEAPYPGIEQDYEMLQALMPTITLEEINERFATYLNTPSRVIVATGAKKEGNALPTEEEVSHLLTSVSKMDIEPYADNAVEGPLMATLPTPGSVIQSQEIETVQATELTLSNGIKVILKPTEFQNGEVSLNAFGPGGTSLFGAEEYFNVNNATTIIEESGVGPFDNIQLQKYLAGKTVSVSPYISELYQGFSASCATKDIETMFQLIHLYVTAPRKDETAFNSYLSKTQSLYNNLLANPSYWFINEVIKRQFLGDKRRQFIPTAEDWQSLTLDKVYDTYQAAFADLGEFTFVLVGNFEEENITPLLNQYIATLPTQDAEKSWVNPNVPRATTPITAVFNKGQEPKSQARIVYSGPFKYNAQRAFELGIATDVLRIMLREVLREDKSGVYGVGVRLSTTTEPESRYSLTISFTCSPENNEELRQATYATIDRLIQEGPSTENIQKVQETRRKDLEVNQKENRFWLSYLSSTYKYGRSPDRIFEAEARIDAINPKRVRKAAKKLLKAEARSEFVLMPATEAMDN